MRFDGTGIETRNVEQRIEQSACGLERRAQLGDERTTLFGRGTLERAQEQKGGMKRLA